MEEFLNKLEKDNPNLYAKVWLKIRLLVIDSL
jgi:hypothetical protein